MEFDKKVCPIINVDGFIESGKQFDLDITLPQDNRNVIYGVIKDCYKDPVCDAVVKLVEVDCEYGKEVRKPVTHTFTNEAGEFVLGPLCPNKFYEVVIWANRVKHVKVCTTCNHKGGCLKGVDIDCDNHFPCDKDEECKPWDKKECCKPCDKDECCKPCDKKECCKPCDKKECCKPWDEEDSCKPCDKKECCKPCNR